MLGIHGRRKWGLGWSLTYRLEARTIFAHTMKLRGLLEELPKADGPVMASPGGGDGN